jgi:hypothetical protein
MKIPQRIEILKLYADIADKISINFENYLDNDDKICELKYYICSRKFEFLSILLDEHKDKKLLLRRLKRNKKQTITLCLELLSIKFDEEIKNLMRTISNKRHTWKIVQDKKLKYSWDFIESIFN